ncbi:hypothetical protein [uncultured Paraglaciecola sp.]|uniref:hypothetical protein n=1 Tax=uncultured Paraglaciecola sp. TaxID=1765024 RepID=UPI0030D99D64|tara:strand:- start:15555 stop:16493 length:939 start_codon:yes stop_codon:yes gene_type:complete
MLKDFYSMPLHGVACGVLGSKKSLPYNLSLNFDSIIESTLGDKIWSLVDQGERYRTELNLFRSATSSSLQVNCEGQGVFKFTGNQLTIDWQALGTGSSHYFQTVGLAVWLEMSQVLCIHGNALEYNGQAIGLVAPSGTGKSTLSAKLCDSGFSWMTDDMMALHPENNGEQFRVYPSWPIARMWPDSVQTELNVNHELLSKVHDGFSKRVIKLEGNLSAGDTSQILTTIYVLNRVTDTQKSCEIKTVKGSRALILLLQNSILGDAYRALGVEQSRMATLSKLLEKITIKEVTYCNGSHNLNIVRNYILEDLAK